MNFANLLEASKETLLMTIISTALAYLIGIPLGVLLNISSRNGIKRNSIINIILGFVVNVLRSIPCLILLIILIPVTKLIMGSWTGSWYTMVIPLFFASFPFVARIIETSLNEVDSGVIEASKSMGASTWQIIRYVMLEEAKPSLVSGIAVSMVTILSYTAFAGYISAGGLIFEAFNLGYYGTDELGMWIAIIVIVIMVQLIQEIGLLISRKIDKRRKLK